MAKACSAISEKEANAIKKKVSDGLKRLGINTGELSRASIEAALNKLMSEKSYTIEALLQPEHKQEILNAIAQARTQKAKETEALNNDKIGNATVYIGQPFSKTSPAKNPNALYVFTDNLQAHNALTEDKVAAPGLVVPDGGVKVNVNGTSAMLRTNTNGDRNPNTLGLVVKKNAQSKDGKFLNDGQGVFEDTDADYEAFVNANTKIIKEIKEKLEMKDSPYTALHLVGKIAMEKAGLPKRFAEALQTMLYNQLGISTQVLPSKFGKDLYGLEVQPFGKQAKSNNQKSERQKRQEKDAKEASESLETERPKLLSDEVSISRDNINILARIYPNIEERVARTDFITTVFSQQITQLLDEAIQYYTKLLEGEHTLEDEQTFAALTSGTEAERRKAFLENITYSRPDGSSISAADYIIHRIQNFMNAVIDITGKLDNNEINEEQATSMLFDSDNYVAQEFAREAYDKSWRGEVLRRMKLRRLRTLSDAFKDMMIPEVFGALLKEAATNIEFNENIRIILDGTDRIITSSEEDLQNAENQEEGSVDNRSGLNLVKYKLLNPAKTLSTRMKVMLSQLYRKKGGQYEYNSLGQRVRMNSSVAYYILLHHFSAMNQSSDFEGAIEEAVQKYPWMGALADRLDEDEDLKREFYTTFRKIFVPYVLIGSNGKIVNLNSTANRESFMQEATRLYEGHSPLSENSIYDIEGLCNPRNVAKVHSWVAYNKGTKADSRITKHPFAWVKSIFDNPNRKDYNSANIIRAVSILRGEEKGVPGIVDLLQALGIPTDTLDIDVLVPYISEDFKEALLSEDPETRAEAFNDLNEILNSKVRGDISRIIQAAINITREGKGYSPGDHLMDKFRGAYNNIADSLAISSEAFSQASFLGMENSQMFSYTMPDRISTVVGIISKAKTPEEARLYIEKEFGKYAFYRDPKTQEWMNTWIETLFENPAVRKAFAYANVLGFNSRKKGNSIQDVNNDAMMDGIITAMFSANDASDGTKMGWFRNPLFSDTPALVMLKMPRYTGDNYKEEILRGLVKTLRQEIDRITFILNQADDTTEIEFFNDKKANGAKFNYFPELNARRAEILRVMADIESNDQYSATEIKEAQDRYLKSLLTDLIEGTENTKGLLETFLDSISEERGSKILKSIAALEASDEKNETALSYEEQQENEEDLEGLSPEDAEKRKEELSEKQRQEVREKLTEFFYNDFFGQIQFEQMFKGDAAQFKNYDDSVKRAKEDYASGEKMYALDANGEPITEKAMYVEDLEGMSTTWTDIRDLLDADDPSLSEWERGIYKGAVEAFTRICKTDGQSWRTIDSYKKLFQSYGGRWTPAMEEAFNHIKSGKFTAADFLALWNPIKPFMVSYEDVTLTDKDGNVRVEKVKTQHKNSEYLISALFTVLNTALNKSPKMRGIQRFMQDHNIDVLHFHSVVKHGGHDFFDINYDYDRFLTEALAPYFGQGLNPEDLPDEIPFTVGNTTFTLKTDGHSFEKFANKLEELLRNGDITQDEYNDELDKYDYQTEDEVVAALEKQLAEGDEGKEKSVMIKEFPLEDYMIVQPTDDHLIDHDALFGSQLRNIVPADLPENFSITVKVNGRDVTLGRDEIIKHYNTLIVDQLLDSFDTVDRKFMSDKDLSNFLQEMMRGNPKYGDDIKDALSIDPKTGRFKMPLNSPNLRNKVEELLLSVFKNNIQRQKIRGGNVVLVSNFGYTKELRTKYINDDPNQGVEYIPAYMPAYMSDMYRDYLVEKHDRDGSSYWTIDFEALKKNHPDEDILKIIGYRIPTEDKYSIMPIKIVGFMPVVAGTTIMLPEDIIAMSGTDFDIDKLFLMIKSTVRETFGPNLSTAFRDWLAPDLRESLKNTDPEQSKTIEKIIRRKQGFSDEELERYADKSELFAQFMDEKGFEYAYDKPHYRVKNARNVLKEDGSVDLDETSKLESYNKKERHDIRNNMLIDTIWAILTSPEGSKLSRLPGSYPGVKRGSRQQWIMQSPSALKKFIEYAGGADKVYEKLMSMSAKELEKFFDTYSDPENPYTLNAYIKKHRNLMDGNALIGVFAVNSSNHYKLQFLSPGTVNDKGEYIPEENILLNEKNQFFFTFPGERTARVQLVSPQKSPLTGVSVGRTAAEFQAASPDNGKDPCLGDLGASVETAYRINFLIHMGFPPEVIGMLNTIDDFVEYGKKQDIENNTPFNGDIGRIMELVAKFRTSETGTLVDPIDKDDAGRIAAWVQNIFDCARTFGLLSNVSRVDSPNGALPIKAAEAVQQMFKMEDFFKTARSSECEIQGLDRLIDDTIAVENYANRDDLRKAILATPIPRLQAAYTLGIKSARTLAGSQIVELRKPVLDAARILRGQTKNSLLGGDGLKVLQKFFSEMPMYLMSAKGSLFAGDTEGKSIMELRNYYIHDFPAKLKAFLDEKQDGKYKHADIRNLTLLQRITNGNRSGIKFNNIGKVSPLSRKHYTEAMDSLLYSADPEVQKLAIDLLMYAYYDNGLNFGPSNYGIFFTTFFMSALPGVIDVLQRMNGEAESDPTVLGRYVEQFMLNHTDFIFSPRRGQNSAIKRKDNAVEIAQKDADFLRAGADGTGDYITYLRYRGSIYKRVIGDSGATRAVVRYEKIQSNQTNKVNGKKDAKNFTPFYDATKSADEIAWDELQQRGAVSSKDVKEDKKKEGKKAEDSVPTEKAEAPIEGKNIPEDAGNTDLTNEDDVSKSLESLEGSDDVLPEGPIKAAQFLEENVENALKAPKDNTPDLNSFKEVTEPENRLCPPTGK